MSLEGTARTLEVLKGRIAGIPAIDKTLTKAGKCADAKATGDAIRALKTVIWQNENPYSQMELQTISLPNMAEYDGVEIVYIEETSEGAEFARKHLANTGFIPSFSDASQVYGTIIRYAKSCDSGIYSRDITIQKTSITINNCYLTSGAIVKDNAYLVPCMILGVKGVK